ncbi:hypothetical protein Van01_55540 [Micromonospora andamanensis]|uniref:Uncharacterized protein n=1 Tax=Micromonospora andamanensis TaxID=1287068 RepID=A0ABQ4I359_9ACTN|nr:hypothetical protein Van01_55540 [Micromonospora andamanensis]
MGLHPVASYAHTVPTKLDVHSNRIDGGDTQAGTEAVSESTRASPQPAS